MILFSEENACLFSERRRFKGGFTLIELIVVIAVLGILAAVLLPVFGNARASARTTQCLSNLRQLGVATSLYLSDHDQVFPSVNYWPKEIGPYLDSPWDGWSQPLSDSQNPFLCPSAVRDELTPNYNRQLSYGINCESVAGKNVNQVMQSSPDLALSTVLLYADCSGVNLWSWAVERFGVGWHSTGINAVYADFHVEKTGINDLDDPRLQSLLE